MSEDRVDLVRLNLTRRVGVRAYRRVVETFGSLASALKAPLKLLANVPGIGRDTAASIHIMRRMDAETEVERTAAIGAKIVAWGEAGYPTSLVDLYDPPLVLYVLGDLRANERCVAIVGARQATPYGRRMAETLARDLSGAAIAVVSGLARGIDAAAHRGAIAGGGRTIAVLGSGLLQCYPREHEGLMREVAAHGAVVTEFPLDTPPFAYHFPRRNRIVSGLALGTCVVEAAEKSGSLITAEWALEQGREVFAVPQRADDPGAAGVHRLIRDGATLVERAEDVVFALGLGPGRSRTADLTPRPEGQEVTPRGLSPIEQQIYALLGQEPRPIDDLIEEAALPASTVFATLTALELKRAARGWPGRLYQKA
jgi:DNA processing protein